MRKILLALLSWSGVFLACYLVLELFLFRYLAPLFPPRVYYYFDQGLDILFQHSKSSPMPDDYIAIFGDSFAAGAGDWILHNQGKRFADSQVTHLLHKQTGRDVVTFGVHATGSIPAYLVYPQAKLQYIRSLWFYDIKDPSLILLYFYEGNDVLDNAADLAQLAADPASGDLENPDAFMATVTRVFTGKNDIYLRATQGNATDNLVAGRFLSMATLATLDYLRHPAMYQEAFEETPVSDNLKARINGELVAIPDQLQTPPHSKLQPDVQKAMAVFRLSLQWVARLYPDAELAVVYIPSPAASYALAPGIVRSGMEKDDIRIPTQDIRPASNALCGQVRTITLAQGIHFLDTRAAIAAAASKQLIHGPLDWNHFSEPGYRVLASEIGDFYYRILQAGKETRHPVANACAQLE